MGNGSPRGLGKIGLAESQGWRDLFCGECDCRIDLPAVWPRKCRGDVPEPLARLQLARFDKTRRYLMRQRFEVGGREVAGHISFACRDTHTKASQVGFATGRMPDRVN